MSSRNIRRASGKLQEFDAEIKAAIAARRAESQQIGQVDQKPIAELRTLVQETEPQYSQTAGSLHYQATTIDASINVLGVSVAEQAGRVSKNRQTTSPIPNLALRHQQRHVESSQAPEDSVQVSNHSPHLRGQSNPIQKTLRQSVWRAVPEWTGDRTSASASNQTSPPEQAVYRYLQTHNQGARLPELESSLGISRFKTVDALHSLIRKELVVQDDKTYYADQEAIR